MGCRRAGSRIQNSEFRIQESGVRRVLVLGVDHGAEIQVVRYGESDDGDS
jgi:hypothetical protein